MPPFTYINREQDRAAIEHEGYLTVGDIGYLDADGYLFVTDRRTDLVLSGGVNIYPAEIEAQLMTMAGVGDCAVFGVPHEEFGQSLVAVIQPTGEVALTAEAVQAFLATKLAGFKIPRTILFRDTLPREDTGKIFKRLLREEYLAARAELCRSCGRLSALLRCFKPERVAWPILVIVIRARPCGHPSDARPRPRSSG